MHGILLSRLGWCCQLLLGIVGPSFTASPEPLAHCRNVASLGLFYKYQFGRCLSELTLLVPLPYSEGKSTRYSDRLHHFFVTIPTCYKDAYANSFFPCRARLWNSLPIELFSLTYYLNGFRSKINRHLLVVAFSQTVSLYALIFLCFFFLYLHALQWLFSLACSESQLKNKVSNNISFVCIFLYLMLKQN